MRDTKEFMVLVGLRKGKECNKGARVRKRGMRWGKRTRKVLGLVRLLRLRLRPWMLLLLWMLVAVLVQRGGLGAIQSKPRNGAVELVSRGRSTNDLLELTAQREAKSIDAQGHVQDVAVKSMVEGLFTKAVELHRIANYNESIQLYEQILTLDKTHPSTLHNLGHLYYTQKNFHRALEVLTAPVQNNFIGAMHYNTLGLVYQDLQMNLKAKESFENAIRFAVTPEDVFFSSLSYAHLLRDVLASESLQNGNPILSFEFVSKAIELLKRCVDLLKSGAFTSFQNFEGVLTDLCASFQHIGRHREAIYCLQDLLKLGDKLHVHGNIALSFQSLGDAQNAIKHNLIALEMDPNDARLHHNLGNVYRTISFMEKAIYHWKTAIQLNPNSAQSFSSLAIIEGSNGYMSSARNLFTQALRAANSTLSANPTDLTALASRDGVLLELSTSVLPQIYQSMEEIAIVRQEFVDQLNALLNREPSLYIPDPLFTVGCGSLGYYLIYQGYNDRVPRQKLAEIYERGARHLNFVAPFVKELRFKRLVHEADAASQVDYEDRLVIHRKIRVGFLSAFFFHHSVGLLTQGVITGLSREYFEVIVFDLPTKEDLVTQAIYEGADIVVRLDGDMQSNQLKIAEFQLDVLINTEIGMNAQTYFLAFSQLALRTASFWGHAITSGIKNVDYFISSHLFEMDHAQERYTECLYKMNGLTTSFPVPSKPDVNATRLSLGLPENANIYLIPQTLYKLRPDIDEVIQAILSNDSNGVLVLLEGSKEAFVDHVQKRFARTLSPEVRQQILFAPFLTSEKFLAMCKLADVVLDPWPVGGGRSSFEIFSVDTPIVMLYNRTSILQLTFGMYQQMGITDLIAYSSDEYIQTALRVGRDRVYRQKLSKRIASRKHVFYNSRDVIREWEDFLRRILRSRPPEWDSTKGVHVCPVDLYDVHVSEPETIFEATLTMPEDRETRRIVAYEGDDPLVVAGRFFAQIPFPLEPIRQHFIEKMIQNGIHRYDHPIDATWNLTLRMEDSERSVQAVIHQGDEIFAVCRYLAKKYHLNPKTIDFMAKELEKVHPNHSAKEWIALRDRTSNPPAISPASHQELKCVTLVITTCKRFSLFVRTIQSLRKSLGNDWADLICDTVVIDDNSSNEDRANMLDKFPEFTFVFKSHSQRGHAKSMNILMSLVKTRYVFYLEDDWEFSSSVASNGRFIRDALAVLQHGVNEHERIIQVLLNNQHGGWQRHLTYTESSAPTASAATSEVTYFFHEYASTHPLHTFSYWPGFSLNPGIWDLKTIRQMDSHFNEMNSLFEREFSLHMWKLGLHVAYLPYVTSIHIGAPPGTNQSAYVLNGLPRSFDLPQP